MMQHFWNYSDTLFPFLVLLLAVRFYKRIKRGRLLLLYLLATVLVMGYANYLADRGINNMYLYHVYSLIETVLLLPFIEGFFKPSSRLMWLMLAGYGFVWLVTIFLLEPLTVFNSYSASVSGFLISFFCFRYFLNLINENDILYFQKVPSFWIVSGLLFYAIASILVLSSYRYKDWFSASDIHLIWKIQQVANMIKFILLSIGLLCCTRHTYPRGSLS